MKAKIRRSLGLENDSVTFASSDEANDTVGLDLEKLLGEVDSEGHHAPNTMDAEDGVGDVLEEDIETIVTIADVLKQAGEEGASPATLDIAQEALANIFKRNNITVRTVSKEAIAADKASATKEVIALANEGIADVVKKTAAVLKNTFDQFALNTQNLVRFDNSWTKEANSIKKLASEKTGAPVEGALYKNRIRIAHITLGDKTTITKAAQLVTSLDQLNNSITGGIKFLDGLTTLFAWFESNKGKVNFDDIASQFKPSIYSKGALSITGNIALFGEEVVIHGLNGISTDIESMMKIMSKIDISETEVWTVGELGDDLSLKPLSVKEITQNINSLVEIGSKISNLAKRYSQELSPFVKGIIDRNKNNVSILDMIVSPVLYFRFINIYTKLLNQMVSAIDSSFDLNTKAATCLLDYYKWSLKNNA